MAIHLWVGGPSTVISDPKPHLLIRDDVVESELNLVLFEDLKHGLSESALGSLWSAFYEDYDRRLGQDTFDLGVPNFLLLLEIEQMGL